LDRQVAHHKSMPTTKTLFITTSLLILVNTSLFYLAKASSIQNKPTLPESAPSPTQVPKSFDKHLLSSQDLFQKAVSLQSTNPQQAIAYFNQSIQEVSISISQTNSTVAYGLRGRLYASLMQSYPQFIDVAISDLLSSEKNPETIRILANLYTSKGDLVSSLPYLEQVGNPNEINAVKNLIQQAPKTSTPPTGTPLKIETPLLEANAESDLIIASPLDSTALTTTSTATTNSLSGQIVLQKGTSSVTLQNSNINSTAQVYITALSGGKNQPLSVLSKVQGKAELGLPDISTEDITIKWWIVK